MFSEIALAVAEQEIWAGTENGDVLLWDTRMRTPARVLTGAHAARVRGVEPIHMARPQLGSDTLLASAATDGVVKMWDPRMTTGAGPESAAPLLELSTSARLTCLAAPHRTAKTAPSQAVSLVSKQSPGDRVPQKLLATAAGDGSRTRMLPDQAPGATKRKADIPAQQVSGDTLNLMNATKCLCVRRLL